MFLELQRSVFSLLGKLQRVYARPVAGGYSRIDLDDIVTRVHSPLRALYSTFLKVPDHLNHGGQAIHSCSNPGICLRCSYFSGPSILTSILYRQHEPVCMIAIVIDFVLFLLDDVLQLSHSYQP